jgi:hypothetical protein
MFEVNDELVLRGKSQKGKNRIRELGNLWVVDRITESVRFPTTGTGPFLMIHPVDGDFDKHARWVATRNDPDFQILNPAV